MYIENSDALSYNINQITKLILIRYVYPALYERREKVFGTRHPWQIQSSHGQDSIFG